ncbi:hypothetical protein GCM10027517_08720 [Phycicoccus ginsengisoli]
MAEEWGADARRLSHAEMEELLEILLGGSWTRLGGEPLDWADLDDH